MTYLAISCTIAVYSTFINEAFKSYKNNEEVQHKPKPWLS